MLLNKKHILLFQQNKMNVSFREIARLIARNSLKIQTRDHLIFTMNHDSKFIVINQMAEFINIRSVNMIVQFICCT